jgi:S-DNA-T family DNA segregation ATPase FtsK/SpoIIIE
LNDPRTQLVCGILLCAAALFLALAFVSYFFTGSSDFSVLESDGSSEARRSIRNMLGLPGARVAHFFIHNAFGVFSVCFIVMLAGYGLRLLNACRLRGARFFFLCTFWLLWGAVLLGFIQTVAGWNGFFRLGGAVGNAASAWLESYLRPLGVTMLLLLLLVIFLIITDESFIPRMQRFGAWLKSLGTRKHTPDNPPVDVPVDVPVDDPKDNPEISKPIDIIIGEPVSNGGDTPENDITVTIENREKDDTDIDDPGVPADIDDPEDPEDPADPGLEIQPTDEVELSAQDPDYLLRKLGPYDPRKDLETYVFPTLDLLKVYDNETAPVINQEEQQANANRIVTTLRNYGIEIEQIKATVGPTVTLYEVIPKAGIRIAKIQNLENDIMLSLSAIGIRIIAPMPGKGTVGIEVPNEKPQVVSMHSVIASRRFQEEKKMRLPVAIGRTITNEVFCFDLAKTPHLLVAGATGQGKSVGLNAIITSLLYKKHPAELKFVLVDPKMVEFSIYKPLLRHYMAAMPDQEDRDIIITDCQKVINTLNSLVIEMEDRYSLLAEANVRNLEDYNEKFCSRHLNPEKDVENLVTHKLLHHHFMPYLVIVIDEYGDFIMQAGKEVERPIQRLAQKARAVGMHMVLATQRPDVKIVTGTIKANVPTRIAFRTQSVVDSRTVLDAKGADQLIGKGDMLYSGGGNMVRIQCAFVDTPEVERIVEHISEQQHYTQPYQLPEYVPEGADGETPQPGAVDMKRLDPMFADVARYVVNKQEGSTSRLQRAFEIGYNRAGKLSDQLEAAGIVGPNKGSKGRDVLIQDLESLERILQDLGL